MKGIDEQLSIGDLIKEMNLVPSNYVVQSNKLITSKQKLSLNESKLIRAVMMQILKEDEDFKDYSVHLSDLAALLGISRQNLYRDAKDICDGILKNPIEMWNGVDWTIIPWVSYCKYRTGTGLLTIRLNDALKPFLLALKAQYAQYPLRNILKMKSVYSLRIYELILEKIRVKEIPFEGVDINISIDEIRLACDCVDKLTRYSNFKQRVISKAVEEINGPQPSSGTIYVTYDEVKKGRSVESLRFHVQMTAKKRILEALK